ncbi:unnamed protein product [Effrenium voratum]|nr:unnamed protein product [Effrenium voratum]
MLQAWMGSVNVRSRVDAENIMPQPNKGDATPARCRSPRAHGPGLTPSCPSCPGSPREALRPRSPRARPKVPMPTGWADGSQTPPAPAPLPAQVCLEDCLAAYEEGATCRAPPNSPALGSLTPALKAAWHELEQDMEARAAELPRLMLEAAVERVPQLLENSTEAD